jgi:hypothetical protein
VWLRQDRGDLLHIAKAIPMLRDAEEVMGRIERVPGVEYTVLVPNLQLTLHFHNTRGMGLPYWVNTHARNWLIGCA